MSSLKDKYGRLSKNSINLIELGCIDKTDHVSYIYKNNKYTVLAIRQFCGLYAKIFDINLEYLDSIYISNMCLINDYIIYTTQSFTHDIELYSYDIKNKKPKLLLEIHSLMYKLLYSEYDSLVYFFYIFMDSVYILNIKDSEIINQTCDKIYHFNILSSIILSRISSTHYILNNDEVFLFNYSDPLYKIDKSSFQNEIVQKDIIGTDYYNNILIYTSDKLIIFNENKIFIKKLTPEAISNIILDDNKLIYIDRKGNLVTRVINKLYTEIK